MDTEDAFPKLYLFLPLLIGMLLYMVGITSTDLWTPDEPRYGEVAREMVERGNYIQPYLNGMPYTEKPPLFFWTVVAGTKLFGGVNQLAVRLPSALSALGIIALLMIFVNEIFDRKTAFLSAIFLITSPEFFWAARTGLIDMLFTFLITLSLMSFYRWYERDRGGYLVVFYACLVLATLAKGPVGIVLPIMVALCFLLFRKEWSRIKRMRLYIGLPITLAVVLAWYIPATQQSVGYDIGPLVQRQIVGRVFIPLVHGVSIYYCPFYQLVSLAFGMAPWSFLMPWAVVFAYRLRRDAPLFFLLCWGGGILTFFTLIASKRELYILSMYPAATTLIALWITRTAQSFSQKPIQILSACCGAVIMVIVPLATVIFKQKYPDMLLCIDWDTTALLAGAGAVVASTLFFCKKSEYIIASVVGSLLVFYVTLSIGYLPGISKYKSPRNICNVYNHVKAPVSEIAMFGNMRIEYVFYAKSCIKTVKNRKDLKHFFDSNRRVFCFAPEQHYERVLKNADFPIYIVTRKNVSSIVMLLLCNQKVASPL
ncbi:MAG: ArnT family glycosyltransferase [Candidatus Scalinduaceae bacterium]